MLLSFLKYRLSSQDVFHNNRQLGFDNTNALDYILINIGKPIGADRKVLVHRNGVGIPRLSDFEIKKVTPSDYRLFQVADMFCSMELITLKLENSSISASEIEFFGNLRDLKKNYLKPLAKFEWK